MITAAHWSCARVRTTDDGVQSHTRRGVDRSIIGSRVSAVYRRPEGETLRRTQSQISHTETHGAVWTECVTRFLKETHKCYTAPCRLRPARATTGGQGAAESESPTQVHRDTHGVGELVSRTAGTDLFGAGGSTFSAHMVVLKRLLFSSSPLFRRFEYET